MKVVDNKEKKRFEHEINGKLAFIDYILTSNKIFLTHTEVPEEFEGQGIGSELVKTVLQEVKDRDLVLVPLCPFVAGYIKRHPKWKELVLRGINVD
ncbi:GNAT family N-acetyltransferase [Portibacter marinus]|uniref:GNAT family N-acetyltransferase n=1 Tax=Portibacter marinus TaxID=2898660 RepID=UPI001F2FADF8|nr:GNAT family N-acetyltransferase [Portibacter marinus]